MRMRTATLPLPGATVHLGWAQWAALFGVLLALALVLDITWPQNPFRSWYWQQMVGPREEERYGFHSRLAHDGYCIEIAEVSAAGAFDHAGIKPGWVPWTKGCIPSNVAQGFFSRLRNQSRGELALTF